MITPRQRASVCLAIALSAWVAGCSRTPGIDQPISMGDGATLRCISASRLSSIPGKVLQLQKDDGEFNDSDPGQFHFIKLTVEVKRSGTNPFDPSTLMLDGACNKNRTPATVTTYDIKPEIELTYVIRATQQGPFKIVLPDGQLIPLDRLIKQ